MSRPQKGWLCTIGASQGSHASNVWLLPEDKLGHLGGSTPGQEPPRPCGLMPSLSSSSLLPFPVCWDHLRDQRVPPRSKTESGAGPSPQRASNALGQKQRPRPWEAAVGGRGEASPAQPWASSSLAVNYSVRGSACNASAAATPPLMAKIDGFLISHGQKAPGCAAHGSCPRCTAAPRERGTQSAGWFSPNSFPLHSSMHLEGCWARRSPT